MKQLVEILSELVSARTGLVLAAIAVTVGLWVGWGLLDESRRRQLGKLLFRNPLFYVSVALMAGIAGILPIRSAPPEQIVMSPSASQLDLPPPDELLNFDTANTYREPGTALDATAYLGAFGIEVSARTPETRVVIVNHLGRYEGKAFLPLSPPNVLTQEGSNDPVSFTLTLPRAAWRASFAIPSLVAATESGVTFPMWSAHGLDSENKVVASTGSDLSGSYIHKAADMHSLQVPLPHQRCFRSIRFDSNNRHFAAFSAVLIDDLALWYAQPGRCK